MDKKFYNISPIIPVMATTMAHDPANILQSRFETGLTAWKNKLECLQTNKLFIVIFWALGKLSKGKK
jgi:hypothetical protein